MTQNEKINALIYEADHEEPPERLFQYTSLGVLSLILQNKTIRFNSLENLDDLEESSLQFCDDNPPVTYVSCWTSIVKESIPMWKLYTQMTDGIRIELPIGPFKDPRTQNGNCVPGSYDYRAAKWIPVLPPSRVDPELVYMAQPYSLNHPNRVIYRDDLTAAEIVASEDSGQNAVVTHNGAIARFKRSHWDFQQEFRYIVILQRARNNIPLKPYYKRNNRAASQLSQSIAELNAKLLALERLRSKGYLAADIYHTQAREIRQQLGKLKTERYSSFESRITTMLEDVRKLKSLIDELEQPLEVFDEKLFHEIVTDICINHHDEMTVTLLGGLRFTEQI